MAARSTSVKVKPEVTVKALDAQAVANKILESITIGVNVTAGDAADFARKEVPVRKTFKYGRTRTGLRFQGRQEVRRMSLAEALGESLVRRKFGFLSSGQRALPSAFPTTRGGRQILGSQPSVLTTDFGSYRSKNRANSGSQRDMQRRDVQRIDGVNRLVDIHEEVLGTDAYGRELSVRRVVINEQAESDLSGQGRAELKRATSGSTLGGALKRSIRVERATGRGMRIKAKVVAGSQEVDYARYVEFGTRRSRAQPFLRPALADAREKFMKNVRQALMNVDI